MGATRLCKECGTRHEADTRLCPQGHVVFSDPPDDILVGRILDQRYEIAQPIGRGGFGAVYLARQLRLKGRPCAVKVARPEISGDPLFATRFEREKKALSALQNRNTVQILDYGRTEDGIDYIIMEYIEGTALDRALALQGRFSPSRAMAVAVGVCHALEEAHGRGILHRDLKPSNVMLVQASGIELPKVIDFGLTRIAADSERALETRTGEMPCTPIYAGYEQIMGHTAKVDHRSDIYSLAAMVYELLTGVPPYGDKIVRNRYDSATYYFMALGYAKANDDPTPISKMVVLEDPAVAAWAVLLERMLARKPEMRPGSVLEIRRRLEELSARMDPVLARHPLELRSGSGESEIRPASDPLAATEAPGLAATLASEPPPEPKTAPTVKDVAPKKMEETLHQGLAHPRFGLLRRPMALAVAAFSIAAIATTVTIGTKFFSPEEQGNLSVGSVATRTGQPATDSESKAEESAARPAAPMEPTSGIQPVATKGSQPEATKGPATAKSGRKLKSGDRKADADQTRTVAANRPKPPGALRAAGAKAKPGSAPTPQPPTDPEAAALPAVAMAEPPPPLGSPGQMGEKSSGGQPAELPGTGERVAGLAQALWGGFGELVSTWQSPAPARTGLMVAMLDTKEEEPRKGMPDPYEGSGEGGPMKGLGGGDGEKGIGDLGMIGSQGGSKVGATDAGEQGTAGKLTSLQVRSTVNQARGALQACLADQPPEVVEMKVRADLTIDPKGTVLKAVVVPAQGQSASLTQCMEAALGRLVFPKFEATEALPLALQVRVVRTQP